MCSSQIECKDCPSKYAAVQQRFVLARRWLEKSSGRRSYVLHELLADWSDVLGEGGAEHHHLLLVGSRAENLLHVASHVQLLKHLVTLIQDKVLQILQRKLLGSDQSQNPARGAGHNVGAVVLQHLLVLGNGKSSEEHTNLDCREELAEPLIFLADLERQLPGVAHDQHRDLSINRLNLLESCKDKDCSLAHARLGLGKDVHAQHSLRDTLVLDLRGMLKAAVHDGTQHLGLQQEVAETGRVDGDIVALDFALLLRRTVLCSCLSCGGFGLRIIFVVQELLVDINIIVCHLVN